MMKELARMAWYNTQVQMALDKDFEDVLWTNCLVQANGVRSIAVDIVRTITTMFMAYPVGRA